MARISTDAQLAKIQKQMAELQKKQQMLLAKTNTKVLAQIVALAKKSGISAEEIADAMKAGVAKAVKTATPAKTRKKSAMAGTKVPPKYRNPVNPEQTWTGRGKAPLWVQELQKTGTLESALIQPTP